MAGEQVYGLLFTKHLGFSDNQIFDTPPGIGNVVGDASRTVGNVQGLFKDGHFEIRHLAFRATGGAHAGSISADNDKFHGVLLSQTAFRFHGRLDFCALIDI
jgi:hypothetical protein